jgi:hypothetical protein
MRSHFLAVGEIASLFTDPECKDRGKLNEINVVFVAEKVRDCNNVY